jgi:phospholipid N-methyltransferase
MKTRTDTGAPAIREFLSAAARNPGLVGAIAPSGETLAAALASVVPTTGRPVVVELGAGTGSVTTAIQRRLPDGGRHVAIEIDDRLAESLRATQPGVTVINGDAEELGPLLTRHGAPGLSTVDAVVSGLPWTLFGVDKQQRLLSAIQRVLAPHGAFTTFGYLHAAPMAGARRFRRLLSGSFEEVLESSAVWRNVPPARIFACRRSTAV